jgi:hypothetical protein
MLNLNPLKKVKKYLHTVLKVKNSVTFSFPFSTFFGISMLQLFQRIGNQHQSLCSWIHILHFCRKTIFFIISALFANFEVKRGRKGSKKRKTYFVNVS